MTFDEKLEFAKRELAQLKLALGRARRAIRKGRRGRRYYRRPPLRPRSVELNNRLNASEARLTAKIGADAVDRLVVQFKAEASTNAKLWPWLYRLRDPYGTIYRRMRRHAAPN